MQTVNISLPPSLAQKLDNAIVKEGYASRSEFIRALIRGYLASEKSLELKPFKKVSIKNIEKKLRESGHYNEKFIKSVTMGLSRSSVYANS